MKRHREDSGFAMLLVFLLAACVAITLYIEIPRVAFQAERQRELLLVDRGNQFKRAIQVFVTDKVNNPTHRYPASIDELESLNNHRYLRHRYVDPMTGKDEWRLVHINGGILTDSVTTQANAANAAGGQSGSTMPQTPEFISQQANLDTGAGGPAAGGAARAKRIRQGDTPLPGAPGSGEVTSPADGSQGTPGNPGVQSANNGMPSIPGQQPGGMSPTLPPGLPGGPGFPGQSGAPGSSQNGQQQPCNAFIGSCAPTTASGQSPTPGQGGQMPPGIPGMPTGGMNSPGFGIPGGGLQGAQSNGQQAAANMINNILQSPRPGGMPNGMPGATVGGGVAGVASKYEAEGIMIINQRTKINEWEYIFDQSKYRVPPNPLSGPVGTQQPQMPNGPGGTPIGTGPIGSNPGAPTPSQTTQPGGGGGQ